MAFENFVEDFASTIEVPKELLTDDFDMEKDSAWDSLAFISTIALIDIHFNVVIQAETLSQIYTFGQLKKLLLKQKAV